MVFVLLISCLAMSSASPIANYWLNSVPPLAPLNQYHAQDASGSYRYGYTGPHHAKMETRSNGVTQGGYSYIDANGILQTVAYSADAENGFRVRASNLPEQPAAGNPVGETPEVAAARRRHLEEFEKIANNGVRPNAVDIGQNSLSDSEGSSKIQRDANPEYERSGESGGILKNPFLLSGAEAAAIQVPRPDPNLANIVRRDGETSTGDQRAPSYAQYPSGTFVPLPSIHRAIAAPATSSYALPVVPAAYGLLHSSLHHTQDSLGQYDYSYIGDTSSKTESRSLDGTTRGAYSYLDANGLLQQVHYIADHNGFRVVATNLPEA